MGLGASTSPVTDRLRLAGVMVGAEAQYAGGSKWPFTLRLLAGAMVATVTDSRSGTFLDSATVPTSYDVHPSQSANAAYVYAGPQIRVGRALTDKLQVDLGFTLLMMAAFATPAWNESQPVFPSDGARHDGEAFFPRATLTGELMLTVTPEVAVRYAF
jgi:hypothetical protein